MDFNRIAAAALASAAALLSEWLPQGHRDGHEYSSINPTRDDGREGSFSVNLNTGAWADFATDDKGGDLVSLYAYLNNLKQRAAAAAIARRLRLSENETGLASQPATSARRSDWVPITPVPGDAPPRPLAHIKRGRPAMSWEYFDIEGRLLGAVYRFKTSDGGKEVLPCCFAEHLGTRERAWRWLSFPKPRPLYGLNRLAEDRDRPVLIVEGEKCADAAHAAVGHKFAALTWPGGSKAVDKADWRVLAGRNVIIWPDCDAQVAKDGKPLPAAQQAGIRAAERIAEILSKDPESLATKVRVLDIPAPGTKPAGWDVADAIAEGWTREQLLAFTNAKAQSQGAAIPEPAFICDARGLVRACEHNARMLMMEARHLSDLHFDDFSSRMRIDSRDFKDADDLENVCWLQRTSGVAAFTLAQARNAARAVAFQRRKDRLRDFIEDLPRWDGTARIELAFVEAWGAPDTELTRAASRNLLVSMIARGLSPGCQADNLTAFEGPQGIKKSRSLRALGGEFYAEITAQVGTADFMRELRGTWLAELSEMDSLRGREASTIKRLLSSPSDRFVEKFQIHPERYPRRAIVVASTNECSYWSDPTGARRLIPIPCNKIRPDLIEENRLQWFAEARELYKAGATWWTFPDVVVSAQEDRQQADPWEDTLAALIAHGRPPGWVSSATIMREWLQLQPYQQGAASATRLGRVMRRLGFTPKRSGDRKERGWVPDTAALEPLGVSGSGVR